MPRPSLGIVAVASMLPGLAMAQTHCSEREVLVEKLASGYGEVFAGGGVQNSKRIFEVWMSEEKGTWTILMTQSNGMSCIMASGTNWREGMEVKTPAGVPG